MPETVIKKSSESVVARSSVVEKVCSELAEYISETGLKEGAKLPTESQLADRFGVSRLAMRESLVRVKALGLIEARQGSGWYVRKFEPADCFRQLSPLLGRFTGAELDQIMEVRLIIEPLVIYKVAGAVSAKGMEQLVSSLSEMVSHIDDRRSFIEYDMTFHSILAKECGNKILTVLCAMLTDLSRRAQSAYPDTVEDRQHSVEYHTRMLDLVSKGDSAGARRAMGEHIQNVWDRIVKSAKC
jgi:GntR family transcriptional repressor for pyruvate dehydrogenase complex